MIGINWRWILILALSFITHSAFAGLTAHVDRNKISEGETIRLTIEASDKVSGQPNTKTLEKDFDVLGTASGSSVRIINGHRDAKTTWTLTIAPKRSGALTIPVFEIDGERSVAILIEVTDTPVASADGGADIFIEVALQPQSPYVQAQLIYTMRLFHAVNLAQGSLSDPQADNALVMRLGEDQQSDEYRNGRRYKIIERRYAIFPQSSGELQLSAPIFEGGVVDPTRRRSSTFGGILLNAQSTRRVRIKGEAKSIQVRPRPDNIQANHWIPAKLVVVNEEWNPENGASVQVGEPITRKVTIQANGLTGKQLPDIVSDDVVGVNQYADKPENVSKAINGSMIGLHEQKIAYIPSRAGDILLPAIEIHWWDTENNVAKTAGLPSRQFTVQPASDQPLNQTPIFNEIESVDSNARQEITKPATESDSKPGWFWVSVVLGMLWLLTLAMWWRTRTSSSGVKSDTSQLANKPIKVDTYKKQFQQACKANNAMDARTALIAWAAAHWPIDPPNGLSELAYRIDKGEITDELKILDRVLYQSSQVEWRGSPLSTLLKELPQTDRKQSQEGALPSLW